MDEKTDRVREATRAERQKLLDAISDLLEKPMIVLSFVWLLLVVVELAGYGSRFLENLGYALWAIFVAHFLLEFVIAPDKGDYLKKNWLTALSLAAPALRLLRVARLVRALRAARAVRSLRLLRVVSTANRGIRAAGRTLARRGLGYVLSINALVLLIGAAGMYAFERAPNGALDSYGEALWWTAMLLTTLGSEYWPKTGEGKFLTWLLALFGFSVFGYITATLASLFVRQDSESRSEERLRGEMASLRREIEALRRALEPPR